MDQWINELLTVVMRLVKKLNLQHISCRGLVLMCTLCKWIPILCYLSSLLSLFKGDVYWNTHVGVSAANIVNKQAIYLLCVIMQENIKIVQIFSI